MYDLTMYNVQFSSVKQWWLKQHRVDGNFATFIRSFAEKACKITTFF